MAVQGFFFRASTFLTSRGLLNNRILQINQVAGVRHKIGDKLKELNVPQKPKRPLSPYFQFIQEHRSSVLKQHPDWKVTDIMRQCAADWRALDPLSKERYELKYNEELETYTKKYAAYSETLTDEQKEALKDYRKEVKKSKARKKLRKELRENNKPKRPLAAYLLYVMEQAKVQQKPYAQLLSELKEQWAEMFQSEKDKYLLEAAKNKENYEKVLKTWELKMIKEGKSDLVRHSTLAEKGLPIAKKEKGLQTVKKE